MTPADIAHAKARAEDVVNGFVQVRITQARDVVRLAEEMSNVDIASHSFNNTMKIFHYTWIGNVQGEGVNWNNTGPDSRIHPCQKPIALYEWLLTNYAKPGQRILDTHLGSGSSAIACNNLGYELVGCELAPDYYAAACKRIHQATAQERLFA